MLEVRSEAEEEVEAAEAVVVAAEGEEGAGDEAVEEAGLIVAGGEMLNRTIGIGNCKFWKSSRYLYFNTFLQLTICTVS